MTPFEEVACDLDPADGGTGQTGSVSSLEDRLRAALKEAMKDQDPIARSAIRSALGAIDNAGSIDVHDRYVAGRHIAGGVQGMGAGDAPRRELDEGQIIEIVRAEVTSRERAAEEYEGLGKKDEAARLHSECEVLLDLLPSEPAG